MKKGVNSYEKPPVVSLCLQSYATMAVKTGMYLNLEKCYPDKESFEFSSPLERRSCSACSIPVNTAAVRNDKSPLERRLSDTALADKQPHQIGCSPGRRFVRKLLSPVVCGLPSPDRYATFNESTTSLTSCETASITSDSDVNTGGLLLLEFGTQDLTDELTLIDKELLIRISWEELSKCGWMSHEKFLLAPNVMKMVQFFNRVAMMVTTSILAEETPYRRAKVIRKAIKLAVRCRFMKNYNSLKAVLSGMQCTPIFRLKASWKQVPSRYRRLFRELSELMSENNNFSLYQKEILTASQNPPSLPFLGNFLTAVAHTYAFKAVHGKYNKNDAQTNSPVTNFPQANSSPSTNLPQTHTPQEAVLVDFSSKNHSRSDSNDSGVVLRMFSHVSDDCDVSPRESESCLSSPEDEQATSIEEVFHKHNKPHDLRHMTHKRRCSSQEPINEQSSRPYRKSVSVDNGSTKYYADINDMINKRPVEPLVRDPLFDCQLQFWKFQISGVQYNIIPRPFIRRFLVNSPFNTEEKSYKLSLQHEPPTHLL